MYHFFVKQDQVSGEVITVTGPDVNHIKNVLRMRQGEQVLISNGVDRDYLCEISSITSDAVTASILSQEEEGTELPVKLTLFQGLPKSDKMELIIQKAVELGAYRIVPVETRRTVVKLDKKKSEAKVRRWNAVSESAAKQSKRIMIPEVSGVVSFKEALALSKAMDKSIIPFEHAVGMADTKAYISAIEPGMSVGIFIGPEGGFEDSEIEMAKEHGVKPVTLGRRILRTETAGLAILSVLMFQMES